MHQGRGQRLERRVMLLLGVLIPLVPLVWLLVLTPWWILLQLKVTGGPV